MARTKGSTVALYEVKMIAIRLLDRGTGVEEVAEIMHRTRQAIWKWRQQYKKEGDAGLRPRKSSGRPRKLDDRQLHQLVFHLAKGARSYGFKTDVWTLKRIGHVIKKEFGVTYHPGHIWKILQRLEFSHQKPEKRAIERNDEEVDRWIKKSWPQYRQQGKKKGVTLVFLDESGRSETPTVIATWAPQGCPPILRHLFNWERCSYISAITPGGKLHYRLYMGTIKSPQIVTFLKHLLKFIKGKIILFWDGGPIHRAVIVKEFLKNHRDRIKDRRLPAYAPDSNPVEMVNRQLKYVETVNYCPKDACDLITDTRQGLERIRKRPKLFPAFFEHAGLNLGPEPNRLS